MPKKLTKKSTATRAAMRQPNLPTGNRTTARPLSPFQKVLAKAKPLSTPLVRGQFWITENGSLVHYPAKPLRQEPPAERLARNERAVLAVISGGHGNGMLRGSRPLETYAAHYKTGKAGGIEDDANILRIMSALSLKRLAAAADLGLTA